MNCAKCGKAAVSTKKINGMDLCGPCGMKHLMDAVTLLGSVPPPMYTLEPYAEQFAMPPLPFVEIPFAELTPADPALEAIGRAFDDAIDLAYLG